MSGDVDILVALSALDEGYLVDELNARGRLNARLILARPTFPLLYRSGVVYRRERPEKFSDCVRTLVQGHEDCDALGPWRQGELLARGHRALEPGDPGFHEMMLANLRPATIEARTVLVTDSETPGRGPYHCIVEYDIGNLTFRDDPSLRLGMRGGIDEGVLARWKHAGVRARALPEAS